MDLENLLIILKNRLQIDGDSLDVELIEQPELYFHAANECANAVSRKDALKEELKTVYSRLSIEHRAILEEQGKKITESLVNNYVETDPIYSDLKDRYNKAQSLAANLEALKETYSQRSWMLRTLCDLHIAGATAKTSLRSKAAEEISDDAAARVRKVIAAKRKERTV